MMDPNTAVTFVKALFESQFSEFQYPIPRTPAVVQPQSDPFHDAARIKAAEDKRARKMAKRLKEKT